MHDSDETERAGSDPDSQPRAAGQTSDTRPPPQSDVTPEPPSAPNDTSEDGPAALIRRHQRGVWRYMRMLGCDDATADDLTQETFLRVLKRDSFVQHSEAATASYLRRTAYNLLVSRHRKLGRVTSLGDSSVLDEEWNHWAGKDLSGDASIDALRDCMTQLTERAQTALRLRFADEVSRIEIGRELGISEHGARNLMQRAKQQLRSCVEEKLHQE